MARSASVRAQHLLGMKGSQSKRPFEPSEWETDCGRAQNSSADLFKEAKLDACSIVTALDGTCL